MRIRHTAIPTILAFSALLLLGGGTAARAADEPPTLEMLAIETAKTPAQHAALAAYFRGKAAEARAEAKRHESMGRTFDLISRSRAAGNAMRVHCERLTKNAESDAVEYDALAAGQEELAKTTEEK